MVQTCFVSHKGLESKKLDICLNLRDKLRFWVFLSVFDTFSHKVIQTWFVRYETWHTTNLVYIIVWKSLESKTIVICCKLRIKFCFWEFFFVFGTFSHKTLFVWYETWHTTLLGISYCVEMVRIKNNTHMLEITC